MYTHTCLIANKQFNYETDLYNSLVKYKLKLEYKHSDTTNIRQSR